MNKNNYHHEVSEDYLIEQMVNTTNPVTKSSIKHCLRARHTDDNDTPTPIEYDETNKHWWS